MPMKTRPAPFLLCAALAIFTVAVSAETEELRQQDRVAASFMLALGRAPSPGEISEWAEQGARSISDLLALHRERLRSDTSMERAVNERAFQDAYGRAPDEGEIKTFSSDADSTYTDLMKSHIQRLADNPAEYEKVIQRAYQFVIRRGAYAEEIDYWKQKDTLSYVLLVGCVEDWARRNQPGLMVTAGTPTISVNSEFLTTVRLSPAIAAEARDAVGLAPADDTGHHLVAAGAGNVVTGGRIHFAAAGPAVSAD